MTFPRRLSAPALCVAVAALAVSAVGCGGDGVEKYSVPRTTEPTLAKRDPRAGTGDKGDPHAGVPGAPALGPGGPAAGGSYRILGAMYPAGQPGWFWFFKFAGPAAVIDAQEANFDALAKSVKFANGPRALPTFDLPAGWARTGPRDLGMVRFDEVLKVGGVECTISTAGGGADGNITRWAGQVGAPPGALGKATAEFTANGVTATRVDLRGPNPVGMGGGMGGKPPFAKQ